VINRVYLPELVRKRLTDVILLQMRLLKYAAATPTVDELACARYLNQYGRYRGRGEAIARWVWRVASERSDLLEQFSRGPVDQKSAWVDQLCSEAIALLRRPDHTMQFTAYDEDTSAPWKTAGATFLLNFYSLLASSKRALPKCFFGEVGAARFSRQDLLGEFVNENKDLVVCPACDESKHHTSARGVRRSDIDHYLPKSLYPHLACHPFNLIPICPFCNEVKSNTDPLADDRNGTRRGLGDIPLPYRDRSGLASWTYLNVRLLGPIVPAQFERISPRRVTHLRNGVHTLRELYDIPARWNEDTIGEQLVTRRLFAWLKVFPARLDAHSTFVDYMDYFLSTIVESQGKEPLAFAMTWWIAALIDREVDEIRINRENKLASLAAELSERLEFTTEELGSEGHSLPQPLQKPSVREAIEAARSLRQLAYASA
jgi:hypothetical protein